MKMKDTENPRQLWKVVIPDVEDVPQDHHTGGPFSTICGTSGVPQNAQEIAGKFLLARSHSGCSRFCAGM